MRDLDNLLLVGSMRETWEVLSDDMATDEHLVVKSNALVQAAYKLTLNEQRLVLLAIAGLHSQRPGWRPGYTQVDRIRITADEYADAWQLSPKDAYTALRDATRQLYERSIVVTQGQRVTKARWVSLVAYHHGEGWAELSFAPHIVPHLTSLSRDFSKYRLGQVSRLRSTYAVRLFEWCIQYAGSDGSGWLVVSVDDLVQRLGVRYRLYNDVRRFVIEPAVRDLQVRSDMDITWEPMKKGRKVTAIKFSFRLQPQGRLDL